MSRYYDVCEALARAVEALNSIEKEWAMKGDEGSYEKLRKARAAFKTALEEYRAYMAG